MANGNNKMKTITLEQACAIVAEGRDVKIITHANNWDIAYATTLRTVLGDAIYMVDLPTEPAEEEPEQHEEEEAPADEDPHLEETKKDKRGPHPKIDREQVAALLKEGKTDREITELIGCDLKTVQKIIRELNPKPKKKPPIDRGKVMALRKAGWSAAKIADEMNCTVGAIYNIVSEIKKEANSEIH